MTNKLNAGHRIYFIKTLGISFNCVGAIHTWANAKELHDMKQAS